MSDDTDTITTPQQGRMTPLGVVVIDVTDDLPIDCEWHDPVDYTVVRRVCNGPRCVAYREARADG